MFSMSLKYKFVPKSYTCVNLIFDMLDALDEFQKVRVLVIQVGSKTMIFRLSICNLCYENFFFTRLVKKIYGAKSRASKNVLDDPD